MGNQTKTEPKKTLNLSANNSWKWMDGWRGNYKWFIDRFMANKVCQIVDDNFYGAP